MQYHLTFITDRRIETIKAVRGAIRTFLNTGCNMGLKEAKDLVEQGCVVQTEELPRLFQFLFYAQQAAVHDNACYNGRPPFKVELKEYHRVQPIDARSFLY